jgi:hypothetical protein
MYVRSADHKDALAIAHVVGDNTSGFKTGPTTNADDIEVVFIPDHLWIIDISGEVNFHCITVLYERCHLAAVGV